MEQMLAWAMIHQELARRNRRPLSEDEFYRCGAGADHAAWRLLRKAWPGASRRR